METRSLVKKFGDTRAVDDISFQVREGEVFGFLGPNGAGKSTAMMILTTLLKPTSGRALVCGYDVLKEPGKVRQKIGYVQQESAVDEFMTGRENLLFLARLNHIESDIRQSRIDDLLELVELESRQDEPVLTYSGGMRKRLDIAGGLLHKPDVLFLDEPTVGLDIQTRQKIWAHIRKINSDLKTTIFVSTHYMEEADRLCGRIAIIDHGKIQAMDSPANLKDALGREAIGLELADATLCEKLASGLRKLGQITDVLVNGAQITVLVKRATDVIPRIFEMAALAGTKVSAMSLSRPTLDDVFISYTGHNLRDEGKYNKRARARAGIRGI